MWMFTRVGAVSIVKAPAHADARLTDNGRRCYQVRARVRKVLEVMPEVYGVVSLDWSEIQETKGRDYSFRRYLTLSDLKRFVARMADDIDYENFKNESSGEYSEMLHDVWSVWSKAEGAYVGREFGGWSGASDYDYYGMDEPMGGIDEPMDGMDEPMGHGWRDYTPLKEKPKKKKKRPAKRKRDKKR